MAGRRRNLTLDEKLQNTKEELENLEFRRQELEELLLELEDQKDRVELQKLKTLILNSGKSYEEVEMLLAQ